jgi:hypothetical protein
MLQGVVLLSMRVDDSVVQFGQLTQRRAQDRVGACFALDIPFEQQYSF